MTTLATPPVVQPGPHDAPAPLTRVAFYDRANHPDVHEARKIAHRFRVCRDAVGGRGVICRVFYDLSTLVDPELFVLAVRGAGELDGCDGGWDDLATAAVDPGRDVEVVILESIARLSRRFRQGSEREDTQARQVSRSGAPMSPSRWDRDRLGGGHRVRSADSAASGDPPGNGHGG